MNTNWFSVDIQELIFSSLLWLLNGADFALLIVCFYLRQEWQYPSDREDFKDPSAVGKIQEQRYLTMFCQINVGFFLLQELSSSPTAAEDSWILCCAKKESAERDVMKLKCRHWNWFWLKLNNHLLVRTLTQLPGGIPVHPSHFMHITFALSRFINRHLVF